jgi:tetratricopeptide (TPR) repeat protein
MMTNRVQQEMENLLARAEMLSASPAPRDQAEAKILLIRAVARAPDLLPPPGTSPNVDAFRFEMDIRVGKTARELGEWELARDHFERVLSFLNPGDDVFWLAEDAWLCTVLAGIHVDIDTKGEPESWLGRAGSSLEKVERLSLDPENLRFGLHIAEAAHELCALLGQDPELMHHLHAVIEALRKKLTPRVLM